MINRHKQWTTFIGAEKVILKFTVWVMICCRVFVLFCKRGFLKRNVKKFCSVNLVHFFPITGLSFWHLTGNSPIIARLIYKLQISFTIYFLVFMQLKSMVGLRVMEKQYQNLMILLMISFNI